MTTQLPRLRSPDAPSGGSMRVWLYLGAALLGFAFISFQDEATVSAASAVSAEPATAVDPATESAAPAMIVVPLAASAPAARRATAPARTKT